MLIIYDSCKCFSKVILLRDLVKTITNHPLKNRLSQKKITEIFIKFSSVWHLHRVNVDRVPFIMNDRLDVILENYMVSVCTSINIVKILRKQKLKHSLFCFTSNIYLIMP